MARFSTDALANLSYQLGLATGHLSQMIPLCDKLEKVESNSAALEEAFERLNSAERHLHAARLILIGPVTFGKEGAES